MIDPIKCSHFIPPKNTKKPLVFWCFHGLQNESINQKWITTDLVHLIVPFIVKRNLHVSFLTLFIDIPFILIFFKENLLCAKKKKKISLFFCENILAQIIFLISVVN